MTNTLLNVMRYLFAVIILFSADVALASSETPDGAPAFLLLSFPLFTVGLLWSMCAEGWVYRRYLACAYSYAVWLALGVNILSGLLIGVGFPFLVAIVGGIGVYLVSPYREVLTTLGSWVFSDSPYRTWALMMVVPWMCVSFWLSFKFELWFILNKLTSVDLEENDLKTMCLAANIVSYGGLIGIMLVLWLLYGN